MPARRGCFIVERFVRPHVVVGLPEGVEDPLLELRIRCRGLGDLRFQYPMHALMGAVLLRTRGRNALMDDAQLQPPRVEAIQSVNAVRGEGRPVVTADRVRSSVRAEESPHLAVHALCFHIRKALAAQ